MDISKALKELANRPTKFFSDLFDLKAGAEHKDAVILNVQKEVEFHGANLWTLIFAILLASIGLNINSLPVIIGAMLISPLMGPIIGFGLSIAINDNKLLGKSFRNLLIASAVSVIISAIYFLITPIGNAQSELLARTSPNFYDVLIAFFGGLAGMVGNTRSEKTNVIPGVAIATALVPPLCTIGYGFATFQMKFIFGASYLFLINCIFICIASLIIARLLKLPVVTYIDSRTSKNTNKKIAWVVVAMTIPAMYFAYTFVKENNFNQNAGRYISEVLAKDGRIIIYKNIIYSSKPRSIEVVFLSSRFTEEQIKHFNDLLPFYHLSGTNLIVRQDGHSLSNEEWDEIIKNLKTESERVNAIEAKITNQSIPEIDSLELYNEATSIEPEIRGIAFGNASLSGTGPENASTTTNKKQVIIVYYENKDLDKDKKSKIEDWLKTRIKNPDLVVFYLKK